MFALFRIPYDKCCFFCSWWNRVLKTRKFSPKKKRYKKMARKVVVPSPFDKCQEVEKGRLLKSFKFWMTEGACSRRTDLLLTDEDVTIIYNPGKEADPNGGTNIPAASGVNKRRYMHYSEMAATQRCIVKYSVHTR
jgi:hypothetical protein